jgi:O-antigen ligase
MNAVQLTLDIALSFFLLRRYTVNDLLKLLILVGSVAAASSLFLVVVFPQYGLQKRDVLTAMGAWQGIFNQKNNCGAVMTFLLLPAFFVQLDGRWEKASRGMYVFILLIIVGMAQSAGSWIVCGSCLVFTVTIRSLVKLKQKDAWAVGFVLFEILAAMILGAVNFSNALLHMIGKDPTMTGRTGLWAAVMSSILKHPFLGYGYSAFWMGLSGESANVVLHVHWLAVLGYAENGVLELWLELGVVGVLLYALVYLLAVKDALYCIRREPSQAILWYSSVLFYVAVSNIGDGILLSSSSLVCIIPFVVYARLGQEARRIRGLRV